jgi:hypothetical protein
MTLPRRRFLHLATGAAAVATMPGGRVAFAQPAPAPRAKGPLVWLDMDQKELDDAYTQSAYAPNLQTGIVSGGGRWTRPAAHALDRFSRFGHKVDDGNLSDVTAFASCAFG